MYGIYVRNWKFGSPVIVSLFLNVLEKIEKLL